MRKAVPTVLATLVVLLAGAPVALAEEFKAEGSVLGCKYALEADTSARSFSAQVSECASSIDPEAGVEGSWKTEQEVVGTAVELASATLSVFGHEQSFTPGYTFGLPINLDELIETYKSIKKLQEEGKRSLKEVQEAKAEVEKRFKEAIGAFEAQLVLVAAEALANQPGSAVPEALEHFNGLAGALNQGCEETGTDGSNPFCSPYLRESPCTGECPIRPAIANDGNVVAGAGEDAEESKADQEQLCPVFNAVQEDAVFVCVPSFVSGNLDTRGKPLVIVGGGALMMIPGASGETTIESERAIVQLGGAIVGDAIKLEAPDIALAGGFLTTIGDLEFEGDRVSVGQIAGEDVLAGVPALPHDWHGEIVEAAALHTKFSVPELVAARRTTIKAEAAFVLAAGSRIDGAGLGSPGADFETEFDPTGEREEFGASHGGLGGYTIASLGTQRYDSWYTMEGRSPISDDPFKPAASGDGGGGAKGAALGLSGGGVVKLQAPEADVTIDGTIDVSGFGSGLIDATSNGDHGGSGAGGSVYLAAEALSGSGTIAADGGSHCSERGKAIEECVSGFGGSGGGGRIAALYEEDPGWSGHMQAHGGIDERYEGQPEEQYLGSGGAGTVFTRSVTFDAKGDVEAGTGPFPEGTLTIDGGRGAGEYPPPDGTPVLDSWSSPRRRLVIEGEARAYGHELDYGEIDLANGATLTSGIGSGEGEEAIPRRLVVKAGTLRVDSTSRVTMTGRGLAGGGSEASEGEAEAAPGQTASTLGHGGSHGGVGGATGAHENPGPRSGSTYDGVQVPSQPGGGGGAFEGAGEGNAGGGVLDLEVEQLVLDGALSADGQSGDGPTASEPAPFDFEGGGGAGGSLLVHAGTIFGSGALTALGGDSCITTSPPLLEAGDCGAPIGRGGGGGGGRVALIAGAACGWSGTLSATGGVDSQAEIAGESEDAEAMRGGAGSVFFPAPTGTCPAPKEETPAPKGGGEKPAAGPEEKLAPSNVFKILSLKTAARGTELVSVEVPGAGSLAGVETSKGKGGRRHVVHLVTLSRAKASPHAAGRLRLTFALSAGERAYLKKHHRLAVTIKIVYVPAGGGAAAKTVHITLLYRKR